MSSSMIVKTAMGGYHVYQVLWEPRLCEIFRAVRKEENRCDRYAMVVYRDKEPGVIVVGHLPREIAKACYFFDYTWRQEVPKCGLTRSYKLNKIGNCLRNLEDIYSISAQGC